MSNALKQLDDLQTIKDKLSAAASAAERPGNPVGQACWGYFAPDVLRLIEDHTRLKLEIKRLTQ